MGINTVKLSRLVFSTSVVIFLLWGAALFILSCDEGPQAQVPWEELDDDGDGFRNGDDLWPFNPDLH